jgi:ABC-type proline/glycine betaine transport system permease subunit
MAVRLPYNSYRENMFCILQENELLLYYTSKLKNYILIFICCIIKNVTATLLLLLLLLLCCCHHHCHHVTGLFFLVLLLNHWRSPLLRLQVTGCSTFCIVCNVPSIAVVCTLNLCYYSSGPIYYQYNHTFHVPHSVYFSTHKLWHFNFISAS